MELVEGWLKGKASESREGQACDRYLVADLIVSYLVWCCVFLLTRFVVLSANMCVFNDVSFSVTQPYLPFMVLLVLVEQVHVPAFNARNTEHDT